MAHSPASHMSTDSMIDEAVRIRDRHQFEIKLNYPFRPDKAAATYDLECYIFIPNNLGIHRESYSKESFYDDLQAHIRFKTPSIPLTAIVGDCDAPMSKLEASTGRLCGSRGPSEVSQFEHRVKLFCCILTSALREFVDFLDKTPDREDRDRLTMEYLQTTGEITGSFRELRSTIVLPGVSARVLEIYAFADEYVSLLVERNSFALLQILQDDEGARSQKSWRQIMDLVAFEVQYRQNRHYPSIPDESCDNEELIFRRNVLKKYMGNVLFLDTRTRHEGRVLEQTLFGIAAGISMLFATAVLFISQWVYGPLTLPVFFALVIGYMFKDRIKELLRVYFSRKMTGVLFDHKMRLYTDSGQAVGQCRESFDFVEEAKIPPRIMKIRDRDHLTEIESDWLAENVVRYGKRIKLSSKAVSSAYHDFELDGLTDIMRFNVSRFTKRMGEPSKELFVLDKDDYRSIKAERVYHLNLVLTIGNPDMTRYKRFRIIFNRRKIKRIETVSVEDHFPNHD
jgi:hypothetical protein